MTMYDVIYGAVHSVIDKMSVKELHDLAVDSYVNLTPAEAYV